MKEIVKPRRLFEEPECIERLLPVSSLKDYIHGQVAAMKERGEYPPTFKPHVCYSRIGDFMTVLWEDAMHYVENCGDFEVCKCQETGRVVGVKVWMLKDRMGLVEVKE